MRPWIRSRAEATPDAAALVAGPRTWTWRELAAEAERIAVGLRAAGLRAGDRVALLLESDASFVSLVHAAPLAGVTLVPLNLRLTAVELAFQLDDAGAAAVIHGAAELALRARAAAEAAGARALGIADLLANAAGGDAAVTALGAHGREGALGAVCAAARIELGAAAAILYTSGTTGRPKGAVLSYGSFLWSAIGSAFHLGALPGDRWLACMPLHHVGGLSILLRSVLAGSAVVLHERFDAGSAARALDQDGITLASFVPTMLARVLEARGDRAAPSSLRALLVGGAAASPAWLERAARQGWPLLPTYGLTEAASQVATLPPGAPLRADGGGLVALPGTELRIAGADGAPQAPGVEGEIQVRGPTLMSGYHARPAETAHALAGGWLRTGDVGVQNPDGSLRVLDRRSDLVVSGGENVYPAEVEAALLSHPDVADAGVAGLPDADLGRRVAGWVVLRPGAPADAAALERHLRSRLAGYKVPRAWRFVEALPRNAGGKLVRRELPGLV